MIGHIASVFLIIGFGGWAVMAQLSGAIIASGQIEVEQNRQFVQHSDGGVVANILVDEGDTVENGDLLIPQDHPLIIAAQVSPINIDELFVFQDVTYAFQHWISARHPNCSVRL